MLNGKAKILALGEKTENKIQNFISDE